MAVGDKTPKQSPCQLKCSSSRPTSLGTTNLHRFCELKMSTFKSSDTLHFPIEISFCFSLWKHRKFQYGLHSEISWYSLFNISAKNHPNFMQTLSFEREFITFWTRFRIIDCIRSAVPFNLTVNTVMFVYRDIEPLLGQIWKRLSP